MTWVFEIFGISCFTYIPSNTKRLCICRYCDWLPQNNLCTKVIDSLWILWGIQLSFFPKNSSVLYTRRSKETNGRTVYKIDDLTHSKLLSSQGRKYTVQQFADRAMTILCNIVSKAHFQRWLRILLSPMTGSHACNIIALDGTTLNSDLNRCEYLAIEMFSYLQNLIFIW